MRRPLCLLPPVHRTLLPWAWHHRWFRSPGKALPGDHLRWGGRIDGGGAWWPLVGGDGPDSEAGSSEQAGQV